MVKRTPTPLRLSTKKRFGSLQRGIRQAIQVLLSTFCIQIVLCKLSTKRDFCLQGVRTQGLGGRADLLKYYG